MPVYLFQCEAGHKDERVLAVSDSDSIQKCTCGRHLKRDFKAEFSTIILSDSFIGSSKVKVPFWKNGKKGELTSMREIKKLEKENNWTFGEDKELTAEANKNKDDRENAWVDKVTNQTLENIEKAGTLSKKSKKRKNGKH